MFKKYYTLAFHLLLLKFLNTEQGVSMFQLMRGKYDCIGIDISYLVKKQPMLNHVV